MAHALRVRAALAAADYAAFFRLYATAPRLGRALMDIYVPKLRFDALSAVVKAFKPSVPLPFLAALLGFAPPQQRRRSSASMPSAAAANGADAATNGAGGTSAAGGEPQAAGAPGAGKSVQVTSEAQGGASPPGESGAAGGAGARAPAAGEASQAAAAAAAGEAGEPLPGCMATYFEGDYVARVSLPCAVLFHAVPAVRRALRARAALGLVRPRGVARASAPATPLACAPTALPEPAPQRHRLRTDRKSVV